MMLRPYRYSPRPWWRPTGIVGSDVVAAYQPKGAANASAALVNIANPGTNDATYHTTAVRWDRQKGWWNEVATTVLAGAALGPYLGPNYTVVMACRIYVVTAGRWLAVQGGTTTFYVTGNAAPALQVRLGGTSDVLLLPGAAAVRSVAISDHDCYADGEAAGTLSGTTELSSAGFLVIGNNNSYSLPLRGEIHALAIYNKPLSARQCKELHLGLVLG